MNAFGFIFTLAASVLLFALPRRLAAIPFLIGAVYMTRGQVLEVGPASFTVTRILVAFGILRVLMRGEKIANGLNNIDRWLILWAVLLIATSAFHTSDAWVFRIGLVWSEIGSYFLFRVFLQDWEDVRRIFIVLCVGLIPLASLMLLEKAVGKNFFAFLGEVWEVPMQRNGHFRAQGPFASYILAGTVGATCFPMALYLWKSHRKQALGGLFVGGGIIYACTSSGPIMMLFFILFGLALWNVRDHLAAIRWFALTVIIALNTIMADPVYFLMARIDFSGGSQGWFRARLIQSSFEHLNEWWLAGTDYTRHWMATGQHSNVNHTDLVNHVLVMGVLGGLPLMFLFIIVLVAAFRMIGRALKNNESKSIEHLFLIWTLGSILFGHICNFISVSLFDQSVVFLYLILAGIGAIQASKPSTSVETTKHSVSRITQSRYAVVGVNKTKEGIKWHKKHSFLGITKRVNLPVKVCKSRCWNPLASNSNEVHALNNTAHAQFHARPKMRDSLFYKSIRVLLNHENNFRHYR
jgi:hypothetical protein